jgi:hypothetical protein
MLRPSRKESSMLAKDILAKVAEALPDATPEEKRAALAELSMEAGFNDFIDKFAAGAGCPGSKIRSKGKGRGLGRGGGKGPIGTPIGEKLSQEKTASVVKEIDGRKVRFDKLTAEDIVAHLAEQWGRPEDLEKQAAARPVTAKFAAFLAEELARPT